jgi:hypothetical protein
MRTADRRAIDYSEHRGAATDDGIDGIDGIDGTVPLNGSAQGQEEDRTTRDLEARARDFVASTAAVGGLLAELQPWLPMGSGGIS